MVCLLLPLWLRLCLQLWGGLFADTGLLYRTATAPTCCQAPELHSCCLVPAAAEILVHDADQIVDVVLPCAMLAALNVVQALLGQPAAGG